MENFPLFHKPQYWTLCSQLTYRSAGSMSLKLIQTSLRFKTRGVDAWMHR